MAEAAIKHTESPEESDSCEGTRDQSYEVLIRNRRHSKRAKQRKNDEDDYQLNEKPSERQPNIDIQLSWTNVNPEPAQSKFRSVEV